MQTVFDEIYKEVLSEVRTLLGQQLQAYVREIMSKPYPDKIPLEQVREEWLNLLVFAVESVITEAVRAANITVQKYHERVVSRL